MKRLLLLLLIIILLLSMTACSGYNGIMREHLSNEDNYHNIEATFCSYEEADDRTYLYVSVEDKSAFDSSEVNSEKIRLELVGDNCKVFSMDSTFYYVAEIKTQSQTLLSFDDGLKNIIKYINDNKSLF